jgi:hypothetical protein
MLMTIKNAVQKLTSMGIITRSVVTQRRSTKVHYQLAEGYLGDEEKKTEIYEQFIFYLPFSPSMNMNKILSEVRKLLVSDILLISEKQHQQAAAVSVVDTDKPPKL